MTVDVWVQFPIDDKLQQIQWKNSSDQAKIINSWEIYSK